MNATTVTAHPHGALMFVAPTGTFFVNPVGTERWRLHAYRPGDTESAGTFLGHYPTRADAVTQLGRILEADVEALVATVVER